MYTCSWWSCPSIIKRSIWSFDETRKCGGIKVKKTSKCIFTGFEVGRGDMLGETGETKWLVTFNREEIPGLCIAAGHQHSAECMGAEHLDNNASELCKALLYPCVPPFSDTNLCICTFVFVCTRNRVQLWTATASSKFPIMPPSHLFDPSLWGSIQLNWRPQWKLWLLLFRKGT